MNEALLILGNIATLLGGIGAVVFTISYGAFFSWRKTEAGRSLFYVFLSLDLLFANNNLGSLLGPDYPGRNLIRALIVSLVTVTVWRLVVVLWRNWRKGDTRPLNIEPRIKEKEQHHE